MSDEERDDAAAAGAAGGDPGAPGDPGPESGHPDAKGPDPAEATAVEGSETPYRNLWVPLVVVPAVVVGIIVLIFALFGQITGDEAGVMVNLQRMISGGKNQRDQAAFNLVRQVLADADAEQAGRVPEWPGGPEVFAKLDEAWLALDDEDDLELAFVVAMLTAHYERPEAHERLTRFLEIDPEIDPGDLRVKALEAVARLGGVEFAAEVRSLVDDEDYGVRLVAVANLQAMPGDENREVLRGALDDPSFEVRAMAAISLSHHADPAGALLLRDLTGNEIYEAVQREEPQKFANANLVRSNRIRAVEALGRLQRAEDREFLAALAEGEPDIEVREAALRALEVSSD